MVFTGAGDKAFCTGGNTKEYAEYYAGNPQEYRGYMRLFNDMVSAILACDKPVICRVNGMRIGGGQEIGMACDFSVAQDLARFGQAGPKHGSAPIGGATDFLPRHGRRRARDGGLRAVRAVLGAQGLSHGHAHRRRAGAEGRRQVRRQSAGRDQQHGRRLRPPRVRRVQDRRGAAKPAKALLARGTVDLSLLDAKVEELCAKMLSPSPTARPRPSRSCASRSSIAWNRNKENSRAWLALNMMTEARAGFRAFNEGTEETDREVDFVALRQRARGEDAVDATSSPKAIQPRVTRKP